MTTATLYAKPGLGITSRPDTWWLQPLLMHPLDTENRLEDLHKKQGLGYCNITKCCTKVCPEEITITDNAIIPLKERVVDEAFDPIRKVFRMFGSR